MITPPKKKNGTSQLASNNKPKIKLLQIAPKRPNNIPTQTPTALLIN